MSNAARGTREERRTIADASHVGKHAVGSAAAWFNERRLARIIAGEIEKILELRRAKFESGESVVSLWSTIENGK